MPADARTRDPVTPAEAFEAGKKTAPDAIELLVQDHREVESYFASYSVAGSAEEKTRILTMIMLDLMAHMTAEEEVFYPAAAEATGDDALIRHAVEEHEQAREIMRRFADAMSQDEQDRTVEELRQAIEEHVEEEETKLFPELRDSEFDAFAIGVGVALRRMERFSELTGRPLPLQAIP